MFTATMQFGLGEEVEALREMVARWAQDRIAPIAQEIDRTNQFPVELWKEMGELGLLGVTVEEEYGGVGLGYLAHTIVVEELARASASVSPSATPRRTRKPLPIRPQTSPATVTWARLTF